MMIQAFRRAKIKCGILSVDTSLAPYTEVKLAIKDERLYLPSHVVLNKELQELEKTDKKIDHPKHGSKDVSDSVAGVVYILQHKEANYSGKRHSRRSIPQSKNDLRKVRIKKRRISWRVK